MRILIFSDIHGSIANVKNYLQTDSNFDSFIFAGDCFGYLTNMKETLNFLREKKIKMILGNHDLYYLKSISEKKFSFYYSNYHANMTSLDEYNEKYGYLYKVTKILKFTDVSFLYGQPLIKNLKINQYRFTLCHGSPENPFNNYIYQDSPCINEIFAQHKFDILVLGHTHKPFIIEKNGRFIINPGSCTLPRGGLKPTMIICEANPLRFEIIELEQQIDYKKITPNKIEQIN